MTEKENPKNILQAEDTRAVATKDSTKQNAKPKKAQSLGNAAFTPMGTVAVKGSREVTITVTNEEFPDREMLIDLSRNDINHEEEIKGVNVLLRLEDAPHPNGVDNGRISRMTLTKGKIGQEEILAHFDNGKWMLKPETPLEIQVMMRAKKEQNGLEMPEVKPAFDKVHSKKLKP